MKQLNGNKTHFPWFDKVLVIQPFAKVYGESNNSAWRLPSHPVCIGGKVLVDVGGGLVDEVWERWEWVTQPSPHPNPSPAHNCHPTQISHPIQSPPLPPLTQPSTPHLTPPQEGVGSLGGMVLLFWGGVWKKVGWGMRWVGCRVGRGWRIVGGMDVRCGMGVVGW